MLNVIAPKVVSTGGNGAAAPAGWKPRGPSDLVPGVRIAHRSLGRGIIQKATGTDVAIGFPASHFKPRLFNVAFLLLDGMVTILTPEGELPALRATQSGLFFRDESRRHYGEAVEQLRTLTVRAGRLRESEEPTSDDIRDAKEAAAILLDIAVEALDHILRKRQTSHKKVHPDVEAKIRTFLARLDVLLALKPRGKVGRDACAGAGWGELLRSVRDACPNFQ